MFPTGAKLLNSLRLLPWFLLASLAAHLWLNDGWKDLTQGRAFRLANDRRHPGKRV